MLSNSDIENENCSESKEISPLLFLTTAYELFSRWQGKCFIGSLEQARLLVQFKLSRFIPMSVLKKVINAFIVADLIKRLPDKVDCAAIQIGDKQFRSMKHVAYLKVDRADVQERLSLIADSFENIHADTDDLSQPSDVTRLRALVEEKGHIRGLPVLPVDDCDLNYCYGSSQIRRYIKLLEDYDHEEIRRQRAAEQMKRETRWETSEANRNEALLRAVALLSKSLAQDGVLNIAIIAPASPPYWDGYIKVGDAVVNYFDFDDDSNILTTTGECISLRFHVTTIEVDKTKYSVSLGPDGSLFTFLLNPMGREAILSLSAELSAIKNLLEPDRTQGGNLCICRSASDDNGH